jgi:hypothetical protein
MSGRTWSAAALLAVAVALPAAPALITSASASVTQVASHGNPGGGHSGKSAHDHGKHKQKGKKAHDSFNLGGTITAVDTTAGTVTFTVHGGKFKALRNTDLTVTATDSTRVRRNGAATLADLAVGDHVRVKGNHTGDSWTASRITAEAPDTSDTPGGDDGGTTPEPGDDSPPAGGDGSSLS